MCNIVIENSSVDIGNISGDDQVWIILKYRQSSIGVLDMLCIRCQKLECKDKEWLIWKLLSNNTTKWRFNNLLADNI